MKVTILNVWLDLGYGLGWSETILLDYKTFYKKGDIIKELKLGDYNIIKPAGICWIVESVNFKEFKKSKKPEVLRFCTENIAGGYNGEYVRSKRVRDIEYFESLNIKTDINSLHVEPEYVLSVLKWVEKHSSTSLYLVNNLANGCEVYAPDMNLCATNEPFSC